MTAMLNCKSCFVNGGVTAGGFLSFESGTGLTGRMVLWLSYEDFHPVPWVAVRSHPIDRSLHPTSALHKKRLSQKQLRGRRRHSYGRAVASTGSKPPLNAAP